MVVWKKCPRQKKFKILWTFAWNWIHAKQIIFGHFRAINMKLKKHSIFSFFQKIWFFFQAQILQALENYFFFKNWKVQYVSFYLNFLSSKNLYKWLLKLNFCVDAFWCKTHQHKNWLIAAICKDFLTREKTGKS